MIGGGQPATVDRGGHPFRHFPVAVSAGAMALAWSRQDGAPHGSTILVDHEINSLGRLGGEWQAAPAETLAGAIVLRPSLEADAADLGWLIGGLALSQGIEALRPDVAPATWWPDTVVAKADESPIAAVLCEAQLAPGRVRAAIVTFRVDLKAIGVTGADGRDELLSAILDSFDKVSASLDEGNQAVASAYETSCALVGHRVKLRLRPTGEARGTVSGFDTTARMQLRSTTGLVERITVDMLRDIEVV
ncbi:MAG: hypothetical protein ACRDZ8_05515 [Acidimicrobiales bacterium]